MVCPVSFQERDFLFFQMLLDEREHGGELREEQNAAAFFQQGGQELCREEIQLRRLRCFLRLRKIQEQRMAADLAELQKGIEDNDM